MEIKFKKKFGEKDIDDFINSVYINYRETPDDSYVFSFEDVEWISNQGLLLITSLLKLFYSKEITFKIIFCEILNNNSLQYKRKILNTINLWEVWNIGKVVSEKENWSKYFSFKNSKIEFNSTLIDSLKFRINFKNEKKLYDRVRITPFIELERISNYIDEKIIDIQITPLFNLNNEVSRQLSESNCTHPFVNNTISHIITKELYENFLDHVNKSFLDSANNWAFMSLSLRKNLNFENQSFLQNNFEEEELEVAKNFFYQNKKYLNRPIIEYSFLDFGEGISKTLMDSFKEKFPQENLEDNEILKYSFKYYSSRHAIKQYGDIDDDKVIIPRGLFDVLTIIKRYSGLMVIRSNKGKIIYDYSLTDNDDDAVKFFGNKNQFFPGTFITIYLPAFDEANTRFDISSIKPTLKNFKGKIPKIRYLDINDIYRKVEKFTKENIYNELISVLKNEIVNDTDDIYINCISFNQCKNERLNKVTLFYLLTSYEININNNVIIFYPPDKKYISNLKQEILNLSTIIRDFIIHPIPLVYKNDDVDWLGIYEEDDKMIMSDFFYESMTKSIDEFKNSDKLLGNFQFLEGERNLYSLLSHIDISETLNNFLIKEILERNKCIRNDGTYLCNGNYYQREFLQLLELLNNEPDCDFITSVLFEKINNIDDDTFFIAITSSSHKILNTLIKKKLIPKNNCLFLDSYLTFDRDKKIQEIQKNKKYFLFGDVLSGGSLVKRLEIILLENNSSLEGIAVLINTIDNDYKDSKKFIENYNGKLFYAYRYPIKKLKRSEIELNELENIIRINPYTNLPNVFSDNDTLKQSIIFSDSNRSFLEYINEDDILINYKIFNNLIHPYFFKLNEIIKTENYVIETNVDESIINYTINHYLKGKIIIDDNLKIFYPKGSDIEVLNFDNLKSKVLKNHSIDVFELERFNIKEGWKFPHITDTYGTSLLNNNVLIVDDGSYTGDSLLQMVNELAYFYPKKIDVISFIGRVSDHKREFFSRIKQLKFEKDNVSESIDINIYFISHWHISTFYIDNSPFTEEVDWIKKLLTFQNLPINIKKIAELILTNISPKESVSEDYIFFPTDKLTGRIPKKEIILIRDEIGKVIGYRFYKENFTFFNELVRKYTEYKKTDDRYKEIELLCMCLLYEPYLYEKISNIMPDIKEKIEEFIDSIFFGISNRKKLDISNLYYDWSNNKKDLLHLFFIIYSNLDRLQQIDNYKLNTILEFANNTFKKSNQSSYILFKLLKFFPLSKDEIGLKNRFLFLKEIILNFINTGIKDNQTKKEFKRYYSFLNTLPIAGDFVSQLQKIKDVYWENDQPKTHAINASYGQSLTKFNITLEELGDYYKENLEIDLKRVETIKESWNTIKEKLLDHLISFFRTFPDFFKPYPYLEYFSKIEGKKHSLINLYSEIDEFVSNIEQKISNLDNLHKSLLFIEYIDTGFGQTSVIRELFDKNHISCLSFIDHLCKEFSNLENDIIINVLPDFTDFKITIPEKYAYEVIINELKNNLNFYSDKSKNIKINVISDEKSIKIEITNMYIEAVKEFSGNEGINCIKYLSDSSLFNFKYVSKANTNKKIFNQDLIFYI